MKIIHKTSLINEFEEKFFAEMMILKTLDHPNIMKLLELFQDETNYYLITEFQNNFIFNLYFLRYYSGGELFDRIKKLKNLTENYAAFIMKQLLHAVFYCHGQQIVHR